MATPSFKVPLTITHVGTATAIIDIDGVSLLTDPVFSPAGTEWDMGIVVLRNTDDPALGMHQLPPIDAVLLSHEDHADNLDEPGRQLLDGRRVITTMDGAAKLGPRSGVRGIRPWETVPLEIGGKRFQVTGTPCQHLPGGECTGFVLTEPGFGETGGLPNAIYFSGDTIYLEELAEIRNKFHVAVALLNFGAVVIGLPQGPLQITMDGEQGARLFRDIGADILVPMHYESWRHFSESKEKLARTLEEEGLQEKVCWLTPGVPKKIV